MRNISQTALCQVARKALEKFFRMFIPTKIRMMHLIFFVTLYGGEGWTLRNSIQGLILLLNVGFGENS